MNFQISLFSHLHLGFRFESSHIEHNPAAGEQLGGVAREIGGRAEGPSAGPPPQPLNVEQLYQL